MAFNSWVDLEADCPIDIKRIIKYGKEFNSQIGIKICTGNLNDVKETLIEARSSLDSMIVTFLQLLYDREILEKNEDRVLFEWLKDDFGRFMRKLDEQEEFLLIKFDEPEQLKSRVGVARLSAYAKILRTASNSLIYESLLKATDEYKNFKETNKLKRTKRTFLYILFKVVQITLSIMGGMTREKGGVTKKGIVSSYPISWQSLMGEKGQKIIKEGYKEGTGGLEGLEGLGEEEDEDGDYEGDNDIEDEDEEDKE